MKSDKIEFIPGGTATSPEGFFAGATAAGIKKVEGALDLGILFSQAPCVTAGVFTTVKIKSASVTRSQARLKAGKAQALVANSGCANAYTGEKGLADAEAMARMAADALGISPEDVLVASTGVTGQLLPMDKIEKGVRQIAISRDGGHDFARAIMTTDTRPKKAAVSVNAGSYRFTIGGVAKGSGMIHPNMATMFCFLTTDAAVELEFLKAALKKSVGQSFNMISVDGDTSPSDTVLLMANGLARSTGSFGSAQDKSGQTKNPPITSNCPQAALFQQALDLICIHLARALARDGEGATRLIEATVSGAASLNDARLAARTIIGSSLVKTAVNGGDPNWGRHVAAVARSGAEAILSKIDVAIGHINVLKAGEPLNFNEEDVIEALKQDEVPIKVNLNLGTGQATAWGCDMSEEYVRINGQYMT